MKKIKTLLILTGLIIIFGSCRNSDDREYEKVIDIQISPQSDDKEQLLKKMAKIDLIYLENINGLVGGVKNIKLDDKYIYISPYNEPISVFDRYTGKFISKLGSQGVGPNEFLEYSDFEVEKHNVLLPAWTPRRELLSYDLSNQCAIKQKMTFPFDKLVKIDSIHYAAYVGNGTVSEEDKYSLLITDKNLKVVKRLFPKDPQLDKYGQESNIFSQDDGSRYFSMPYNDTVYHITATEIYPKYRLDFGDFWADEKKIRLFGEGDVMGFSQKMKNGYVRFVKSYASDQNIIVSYYLKLDKDSPTFYVALYDHSQKKTYNISQKTEPLALLFKNIIRFEDNKLLTLVEADDLIEIMTAIKSNETLTNKIGTLSTSLTNNSNPILVSISMENM